MIAHKHITKIIAAGMAAAVCLCLCTVAFSGPIAAAAGETGVSMAYETALFDTSSVLEVNIRMDEADWNDMLANAAAEEYYQCDVEIGGTTFYRVAIRPKGNTSLTSIASDPTTDRYSFKLEFDHYVDGQTCFGLDKLILNNNYADATNMKKALIYDMYQYLGADASLYNYAKLSVNGEYWGVYLALEAVEDSFLLRNYGVQDGELYKPDSMNIGGGGDPGGDFKADDMDFGDLDLGDMTPNSVVNDSIDNAFSGTTFFDTLMENETYHSQYYAYLQQLVSEYIDGDGFDAFYTRVRSQIDALVESDPTAFYSYDEYLTAAETLYQVVKLRGQSIQGQLGRDDPLYRSRAAHQRRARGRLRAGPQHHGLYEQRRWRRLRCTSCFRNADRAGHVRRV